MTGGDPTALRVRRLHPDAIVPRRTHPTDAGLDLHTVEGATLPPGGRAALGTGLAIAVPPGFAGLVLPRSGLARRHGVTVANAPGLIDSGYRGELQVLLVNLGDETYEVAPGDRVAQLVLTPVATGGCEEVDELPASDGREAGGFGSSGR